MAVRQPRMGSASPHILPLRSAGNQLAA